MIKKILNYKRLLGKTKAFNFWKVLSFCISFTRRVQIHTTCFEIKELKKEIKMHYSFYLVYLVHRFLQSPSPSLKNSHMDLAEFLLARTKPKRCVPCRVLPTFFQQYDQAGTFCRNHWTGQASCYLHVYSNIFFLKIK